MGGGEQKRLYARARLSSDGFLLNVALVPFCEVGAIHLLAAFYERELGKPESNRAAAESLLRYALGHLLGVILESDYLHIEVRVVNAPRDFLLPESVAGELRKLKLEVGVSMTPYYTNPYHPVEPEKLRLIDLDEMRTIAVAHLDADGVGEKVVRLSELPVLLAAFSEFLSLGFGAKAYACLLRKVRQGGEGPQSIILYASGDDAAVYGRWYDVVELLSDIAEEVLSRLLRPLTASGGVALADSKTPILHLFTVASEAEREAKERARRRGVGMVHIQQLAAEPIQLKGGTVDLLKLVGSLARADRLSGLKTLVYALAELANEASKLAASGGQAGESELLAVARVVVSYKYLIARRGEDFEELERELRDVGLGLPSIGSKHEEVVRSLAELKPVLDLLALRLRE